MYEVADITSSTDATNAVAAPVAVDNAPLVIDEGELERLERELADAADTLEAVEKICASGSGGADTAIAIRQLLDDGRFVLVDEVTSTSDLIGDGHIDSAEQIDSIAE